METSGSPSPPPHCSSALDLDRALQVGRGAVQLLRQPATRRLEKWGLRFAVFTSAGVSETGDYSLGLHLNTILSHSDPMEIKLGVVHFPGLARVEDSALQEKES